MIHKQRAGFTIIEVMLFLAVSGMLIVGILAGTGAALARQRYKDAVATLHSDIQQLYEDAVVVQNDRTTDVTDEENCVSGGSTAGTSGCVILGTLMTIAPDGKTQKYRIIGNDVKSDKRSDDGDIKSLQDRNVRISNQVPQESTMEWDTRTDAQANILVLRSPDSGATYTFMTRGNLTPKNVATMMNNPLSEKRSRQVVCVKPNGWTIAEELAIAIDKNAASANAVEVLSKGMMSQRGGSWPCS